MARSVQRLAGSLSSQDSTENIEEGQYLVCSTAGQVYNICNHEKAVAGILMALQQILAKHPATRPVIGVSHEALRRGKYKGDHIQLILLLHACIFCRVHV